jgi:hypothetical protein
MLPAKHRFGGEHVFLSEQFEQLRIAELLAVPFFFNAGSGKL